MTPAPPLPSPPPGFRGGFRIGAAERASVAGASGILRGEPLALVSPTDADDLSLLVEWAGGHGLPLIPRGAGTGMPGGNVGAGVVVDLVSGFAAAPLLEAGENLARVGPGVVLAVLNAAARPEGLRFPVDPSSGERCTLGGMIANNAAGPHTLRYGATRAWVDALEVVTDTGEQLRLARGQTPPPALAERLRAPLEAVAAGGGALWESWPRVRKNSSGYALRELMESGDLVDLLVGSEGTLALVTGAELRLDAIPAATGLALLELEALESIGEAVQLLLPLDPATCELLDRTFLDIVRRSPAGLPYPVPPATEGLLFVEVEGDGTEDVRRRLDEVRRAVRGVAARCTVAPDAPTAARLWSLRRAASPLLAAEAPRRISMQFIEDGVVPVDRLSDYLRALRRILAAHGMEAVIFGHAGDGNLHVNPLVDVGRRGWRRSVAAVLDEVTDAVAELGGTLAGEHGDGRLRAPLLERIWSPEAVHAFRAVKQAFDPRGILNPGVILPLPGQRPLDALPARWRSSTAPGPPH
jgi:FAD/FMN-containing dehydrogenase